MAPEKRDSVLGETKYNFSQIKNIGEAVMNTLSSKKRKVAATALAALSLAGSLPAVASGEHKANGSGIELIAISGNDIFVDDAAKADQAAQEIEDLGANAVRIFYPLNKTTAWENYHDSLCNAARAAYSHNLQLIVTFNGYDENGLGYYPTTMTERKQFATTASSILWTLASSPNGCVPQQKNQIFEGINEENNNTFNESLGPKTPEQALILNSILSKILKREAAKPEVKAKVLFGEALAVGNHDVTSFLSAEGQVAQAKHITNPYDFIDIHPYPANPTDNPVDTMTRLYPKVSLIRDQFFSGSKIAWGEWGVNTLIPTNRINNYNRSVPTSIGVTEKDQARYTTDFLNTASQQGVKWVSLFKARDDGGGAMPSSGEIYKNGSSETSYKTSYRFIQNSIRSTLK